MKLGIFGIPVVMVGIVAASASLSAQASQRVVFAPMPAVFEPASVGKVHTGVFVSAQALPVRLPVSSSVVKVGLFPPVQNKYSSDAPQIRKVVMGTFFRSTSPETSFRR